MPEKQLGLLTEKTRVYLLSQGDYAMDKYNGWTYKFLAEGQDLPASAPQASGLDFSKVIKERAGAPITGYAVFELRSNNENGKQRFKLRLVSFEPSKA